MDAKQILEKVLERGLFIEKPALEELSRQENAEELLERAILNLSSQEFIISYKLIHEIIEAEKVSEVQVVVKQQSDFFAKSREIPAMLEFNSSSDVSNKSRSTGTINDFVSYFRDRFQRISKYLEARASENGVTKISQLKEFTASRNCRIIGMVSDKRETKNGHVLLEVEDEEQSITCLIPSNSKIFGLSKEIMLDDILAFDGYLSNSLFIVKDVIWPEIPIRQKKLCEEDVSIAFLSDLHVGSKFFMNDNFQAFLKFINGDGSSSEREIASKIKYILLAGDLVDGIGIYPTQEKQLLTKDIYAQYSIFCDFMKAIPEYIELIICPGNHDGVRNAEPQPRLPKEFTESLEGLSNIHFVGNPSSFKIHGLNVLMYHGTSLDTIIANMDIPNGYSNPEKVAVEMLKRRHLSPVYGEKPIVPENRDYLVIEEIPDLFHFGHVHKNGYINDYRGTVVVNSGTWQSITDFQVKQGHIPSPCQLPIYNLRTGNLQVMSFA